MKLLLSHLKKIEKNDNLTLFLIYINKIIHVQSMKKN